jgi:hypothetical protein
MNWWQRLWRRKQMDDQLDKELAFHLEQHATELVAQGHSPEEARRRARIDLGGPAQVVEQCRDARGARWLEDFLQDLRYGLRALRRNPAFAAVALGCLALAIGVNSAIFSLTMEAVFARPSVRDPQSLLFVQMDGSDICNFAAHSARITN